MSRSDQLRKIKQFSQAIKWNRTVIQHHSKPHERDLARYRIGLLKQKIEIIEQRMVR